MYDPGEIRVWPGTIFETQDRRSLTIKLSQIHGETWDDFLQRVDDIANYAVSKCPHSEPSEEVFDFSDTTKYKQVGPSSWEALTPGYESEQDSE